MDVDLTLPQLRVLWLLAEAEHLRMSLLAHKLEITTPACTHLVDRLVKAGFVDRSEDPDDRRVVRCSLTAEGHALAERLNQSMPFEQQEFLDRLTVEELDIVVQAMAIFQRVMSQMASEQSPDASSGDPPSAPAR